jgi:hypothetical protein
MNEEDSQSCVLFDYCDAALQFFGRPVQDGEVLNGCNSC